jgi:predicted  nucleic acid-binding Zn-ribbon protein
MPAWTLGCQIMVKSYLLRGKTKQTSESLRRNDMEIRQKFLKNVISRLVIISILTSIFLASCGSSTPRTSSVNWLMLVLAIVLIVVLGVALGLLVKSGIFSQWFDAGIKSGKWKIQERKLKGQKENIEQEKQRLITALGKKAWEAKVYDPAYAETYAELETLDAQQTALIKETDSLETKLKQTRDSRDKVKSEYEKQLEDLQSMQKDVSKKFEQSESKQSKLQKDLEKLKSEQEKTLAEISDHQQKIDEVYASDAPDKDSQAAALNASITSLQSSIAERSDRISGLEMALSKLATEQQPYQDQISRLGDQITTVERNQNEALMPLDQRIADLEEIVKSKKETLEELKQKITPLIPGLGPLVESSRPESGALTEHYAKIDRVKANLGVVTQEHNLIVARLDTSDQSAVRYFYLMVAGLLILLVLIVVLFILAFV